MASSRLSFMKTHLFELVYGILNVEELCEKWRVEHVDEGGQVLVVGEVPLLVELFLQPLQQLQGRG